MTSPELGQSIKQKKYMSKNNPQAGIKPKTEKKISKKKTKFVVSGKPKVDLCSFSVKATIPTMMYGNIIPDITVMARTIEEAQNYVMPYIEALFDRYSEKPLTKPQVTVTEKKVDVPAPAETQIKVTKLTQNTGGAGGPLQEAGGAGSLPGGAGGPGGTPNTAVAPKSEHFIKAENAIASAVSIEAVDLVEDKIKASVKISADEKQELFTILLKNKNALK